ncbi:MAG: 5-bromo-4-chloroindolyl phosphate hydrolysis family protein [Oscillospiraceae bacterium]|nr:5-bromo-4-chloroindolyl phosphate hydrolysis family protein [Oscillospiraceae bacterium]
MKKIVKKSAIPLYVVALTWVLYGLLFPLYRLPHFLLAIAATAVVGVIARCFCGNVEVEVPEEPVTTGNAELDKMLAEGKAAIEEMKVLDAAIDDEGISGQIVRLQILAQRIFDHVEANPEKLRDIRRFMNYYLPTTLKVLRSYDVLEEQQVEGENITSTMKRVENMMSTIIRAFEKQLDNLFSAEALDISTDMVVMEQMLAREGITEDGLKEAVREAESSAAAVETATQVSAGEITLEL